MMKFFQKIKSNRSTKDSSSGFTLLLAVVTTSMLLIVSFVVVNVALKQVIISNAGRESQHAFYAADAGTECAVYWDLKDSTRSQFATSTAGSITCSGEVITTGSQTAGGTYPVTSVIGGGGSGNPTSVFTLLFPKGCAVVRVTKGSNGVTTIDSRGYNTCNSSSARRYERGVTLTFENGVYAGGVGGGGGGSNAPTLASSLSSVAAGSPVTASWTNLSTISGNPAATNWIGLYSSSAANELDYVTGAYIYAGSCTTTSGSAPASTGSCPFTIPSSVAAGSYYLMMIDKFPINGQTYSALAATSNITVTAATLAYGGTPVSIPGTIQAENFDTGAEGVSYHDLDASNNGGAYRSTGVDISTTADTGGGHLLGWTYAGEWLNYAVNVTAAGNYTLAVRVASAGAGGTFHIEVGGVNVSGTMTVPNTGGWDVWTTLTVPVTLASGNQTLKLVMDTNGSTTNVGNFNYITLTSYTADLNGFAAARAIRVDRTKVSSTLTNFPVLVSGTYSYLATTGNGGSVQNSSGHDIVFTIDPSCKLLLKWDAEKYVASTGEIAYWVRVPLLSSTVDTTFYMCYGKSSISTAQSDPSWAWDTNYRAVWHLANGTTLSAADASGHGYNGTINGATASVGNIDGGAAFNGSQNISINGSVSTNQNVTISGWVYRAATTQRGTFIKLGDPNSGIGIGVGDNGGFETPGDTIGVLFEQIRWINTGITLGTGWHYFALVLDGSGYPRMYKDGVSGYSDTAGAAIAPNNNNSTIGGYVSSSNTGRYFTGSLDEMRVSSVARSADWILTEYRNQSSPSTFFTANASTANTTNYALNRPVTSQTASNPPYNTGAPSNLTDGNTTTNAYNGTAQFTYDIDLGQLRTLSVIAGVLKEFGYTSPNVYITSWTIQGMNSGGAWVTLASGGAPNSDYIYAFPTIAISQIRISAQSTTNWMGIYEVVAY